MPIATSTATAAFALHPVVQRFAKTFALTAIALSAGLAPLAAQAQALEKFTYITDWFAQAEHGGFYQSIADGTYKKYGLEVTVRQGGPQVNAAQIMAAGQADCITGSSDVQVIQMRESGLPIVNVAAMFQKNPQVIIAHEDVKTLADLKGKTIFISSAAQRDYWPWLKTQFSLSDSQTRPYTYNIQPFVGDKNSAMQGYLTSEPYSIQKAGVKATTMLMSDAGYPAYASLISCMEKTLKDRNKAVANFVKGTAEGFKNYLKDPTLGNAEIKKANPSMTDDQLAYSVAKLKETGIITGGDAATMGIGVMTAARAKATYDFLIKAKLVDPAKVALDKTWTTDFMKDVKVLP